MASFPPNVIREILSSLTVKDLVRFRCVSKFFRSLINCPDFGKQHLSRSKKSTPEIYGISEYGVPQLKILDFNNPENQISELKLLNQPPSHHDSVCTVWVVVGSCNGWIALGKVRAGEDIDFVIWNPFTGKFRNVPPKVHKNTISYGFGYDPNTDDYKLVSISIFDKNTFKVTVYSLKANSWKGIVVNLSCDWRFKEWEKAGVLVNNALHWMVYDVNHNQKIIAFDLVKEKFYRLPDLIAIMANLELGIIRLSVFEGCLILISNMHGFIYVFAMEKYGDIGSWKKLFLFFPNNIRPLYKFEPSSRENYIILPVPVTYSRNRDKVLLTSNCTLGWYDLVTRKFVSCGSYVCEVKTFTASLVALKEEIVGEVGLKRKRISTFDDQNGV